jgi:hypothetical protein
MWSVVSVWPVTRIPMCSSQQGAFSSNFTYIYLFMGIVKRTTYFQNTGKAVTVEVVSVL